jgi:inosine-uridine nucleoside N-ribohydrolase
LLDLRAIVTTAEQPSLSAQCVAKHLYLSNKYDIPVYIGDELPPYEKRGGVCAIPDLIGFPLQETCDDGKDYDAIQHDGVRHVRDMIMDSKRDDWWYIAVGGQTSLQNLITKYPNAAKKIDTIIFMGGNWCAGFEPYPDVVAPTDETNISCDPIAANILLDQRINPVPNIYYVPVEVASAIGGSDYRKIVASKNLAAQTTIDFYRAWSDAARQDKNVLTHAEAMAYDPETESTPQFDACAVMLALQLAQPTSCPDLLQLYPFDAVRFLEPGEGEAFPDSPRNSFSVYDKNDQHIFDDNSIPTSTCPKLTPYTFDSKKTKSMEKPVEIALGYTSKKAEQIFFSNMAERMAGTYSGKCA